MVDLLERQRSTTPSPPLAGLSPERLGCSVLRAVSVQRHERSSTSCQLIPVIGPRFNGKATDGPCIDGEMHIRTGRQAGRLAGQGASPLAPKFWYHYLPTTSGDWQIETRWCSVVGMA